MRHDEAGSTTQGVPVRRDSLREWTLPGLHDHLFVALPPLPPGPVLDIACGTGAWLERFPERERVGIERDSKTVVAQGVSVIEADVDRDLIDAGRGKFALVSALEIVEHLENPGRLLALASEHLQPGGYLILSTPNVNSVLSRARWLLAGTMRFFDESSEPTHIMAVTLRWLDVVLPRHGLNAVRIWGYPERGHIMCKPATARLALLLEKVLPRLVSGDTLCVLARRADR